MSPVRFSFAGVGRRLRALARGRGRRFFPGATPGVLLVATLFLAGWLGYQALDAASSHRRTAESVLRDYAGISATEFRRTAQSNLGEVLDEVFSEAADRMDRRRPPSPRVVGWKMNNAMRTQRCRCRAFRSPLALFRIEADDGAIELMSEEHDGSGVEQRLVEVLGADGPVSLDAAGGRSNLRLVTAPAGRVLEDEPVAIGYMVARDRRGAPEQVFGFVVSIAALTELFQHWYDAGALLPQPIAGDRPNEALLYVTVQDPQGLEVFASPVAYPATLSAVSTMGEEFGGLTIRAALRPDAAPDLIIGGLPNSRLPLLAVLLLLTLGVGITAVVQLRRERTFQRLRDDFVSGVSHELRTPLAQIRMFSELQEAGKLEAEEDRRRATAAIHRESRRLSHLVENILQFSRLRRRPAQSMPRQRLDLAAALTEGLRAVAPLLEDRGMRFAFEAPPGPPVLANRDALHRVIVNLLENAMKYGPRGQTVRVVIDRTSGVARFAVEDQGPGIAEADRERIWRPYSRLERDVRAQVPGSGIGLSVVAELVALQQGRAWVEEAAAGGARFVVELPLVIPRRDGTPGEDARRDPNPDR